MKISNLIHSIVFALLLFAVIIATSCKTDSAANKCKFGEPTAIFNSSIPTVTAHQFDMKGAIAIENIVFESGKELEITQSGCNEIQQELIFRLKNKKISVDPELFALGIQNLDELGKLAEPLKAFSFWAQAIYNKADLLKKGMEVEIESNTFATIDLIEEGDDALIRVVLARR